MRIEDFINEVKRRNGVDTDGAYGKQCVDLHNFYCKNVLKIQGLTGASRAKYLINNKNLMKNFVKYNNTPTFIPQKGDIAVWCGGTYGHVAICLGKGDLMTFESIDQNWKPQQLTIEKHNYIYLAPLVFLRPKNQENIKPKNFLCIVEKPIANVRATATSNSSLAGSKQLKKGDKFYATNIVSGENVNGNNKWIKSAKGNYVWSGGIKIMK